MIKKLPLFIKEKILAMPEYKYGVNKVKIYLSNGTVYSNVYVAWGDEIIKVGNSESIPFDPIDVVEVENEEIIIK